MRLDIRQSKSYFTVKTYNLSNIVCFIGTWLIKAGNQIKQTNDLLKAMVTVKILTFTKFIALFLHFIISLESNCYISTRN